MIIAAQINCDTQSLIKLKEEFEKAYGDKCILITSNAIEFPWRNHVIALQNTVKAFRNNKNIAKKVEIEYLIRLYNDRQINRIINKLQEKPSNTNILLIYCKNNTNHTPIVELLYKKLNENMCRILEIANNIESPENIQMQTIRRKNAILALSGCSNLLKTTSK